MSEYIKRFVNILAHFFFIVCRSLRQQLIPNSGEKRNRKAVNN